MHFHYAFHYVLLLWGSNALQVVISSSFSSHHINGRKLLSVKNTVSHATYLTWVPD